MTMNSRWDGAPVFDHPSKAAPGKPFWLPCRTRWEGLDEWAERDSMISDSSSSGILLRNPRGLVDGCRGLGMAMLLGGGPAATVWNRTLLRHCDRCRAEIERDRPGDYRDYTAEIRSRITVSKNGYVFYRSEQDRRQPWQKLGLSEDSEFIGFSIKPAAKRTENPYIVIPPGPDGRAQTGIKRMDRRPGTTYIYRARPTKEDPHADDFSRAFDALQGLVTGKVNTCALLAGHNGTGKSHLVMAAAQDLVAAGKKVRIFSEEEFSTRWTPTIMLSRHDDDAAAELARMDAALEAFKDPQILIWDELAFAPNPKSTTELAPSFVRAIAGLIFARRKEGKITIWTTNATLDGLESRLGSAILSRIKGDCAGNVFWLKGRDWRDDSRL